MYFIGINMESIKTITLKAISNTTRQFLLRLISLDKDINIENINSHIKINQDALKYHIDVLKNANLIHNNTFNVEGEQRTVYNISSDGKECLKELGFK